MITLFSVALVLILARDRRKAQQAYWKFVAQGVEGSLWEGLHGQIFLGSEKFIESIPIPRGEELRKIPQAQWSKVFPYGSLFKMARPTGGPVYTLVQGCVLRNNEWQGTMSKEVVYGPSQGRGQTDY